jgi:amino acid adenylation domain-containing protein
VSAVEPVEPIVELRASGYPRRATLPELVAEVVARAPDRTALVHGGTHLSYGELRRRAAALAGRLRALGVGRRGAETPVGIALDRSPELVVAILAVLEAGGFYVPLDPGYPAERLRRLLAASGIGAIDETGGGLVLTDSRHQRALPLDGVETLLLDRPPGPAGAGATPELPGGCTRLAYVLFTSGSTGEPKGVAVAHRAVARLVCEPDFARLDADETILLLAPISFDASTLELWGALIHGGRLEIVEAAKPSLDELTETIERGRVTTLWLTAGLFHQVVDHRLGRLRGVRQLLAGGDVLSVEHVRRAVAGLPDTTVINGYGPTENTTFTTCHPMDRTELPGLAGLSSVPIGRPISDTRVLILDDDLEPVPPGVEGEIYAGGDGLARGYLGRPGLTAERFVPAPGRTEPPGERLYRTGDRARWRDDGVVEFFGRRDGQVKLRGFRIETGEIESALCRHPAVRQAVVVLRRGRSGSGGGDDRLVGYLVPEGGDAPTAGALAAIREHLAARLPEYMVPAALVPLPALPLDPNGKVDRRRLPAPPDDRSRVATPYRAPAGATESTVARVLSRLCGVHPVGADDRFLELGGHSLLATQVSARVATELGVELPLAALLDDPTVAELAARIDAAAAGGAETGVPALVPVPRPGIGDRPLPLSPSQERVWFLLSLDPANLAYQFQAALRFTGDLDLRALRRALDRVIARHEAFRTTFPERGGVPVQVIHPPVPASLATVDLSGLAPAARERARRGLTASALAWVFDVERLPLVRWLGVRLAPDDHLLLHLEHHLVHDGWSFHVFLHDLAAGYRAALACGSAAPPPVLPPLAIQFADVAVWQRKWLASPEAERQRAWWRDRLTPPPPALPLPWDRPRPAAQTYRGAAPRTVLPSDLGDALRRLGRGGGRGGGRRRGLDRGGGATLYMTLLAGFQALLARYTGVSDVATGCGIANRRHPETERVMGMLVNNVVLRTDLGGDPGFRELLGRVRTTTLASYEHQDLPFDAVVEAVRPERDPSYNPLYQAMFSFHDSPLSELDWPGLEVDVTVGLSNGTAKFDLNVIGIPRAEQRVALGGRRGSEAEGGEIEMVWEHNLDLFDPATVLRMIGHYRTLLAAAAEAPETPLSALPLLSPAEAHQVRAEWNDRASGYPREASIPALVAEVAEAAPERVALVFGAEHVTYGALRRRALTLAGALAARMGSAGAGAETAVALALDRSPELVVALLAVLEAGGFYVPLDPSYPEARLRHLIATSGARLAVTDSRHAGGLPLDGVDTLLLDTMGDALAAAEVTTGLDPDLEGDRLAYVLFTSGSTGEPKGVAVPHRAVVRLVREPDFARLDDDETLMLLAPVSFDASTLELWGALLQGGRLEIVEAPKPSLDELAATLRRGRVTTAWLTAGLFHQMVDERLDVLTGLRQLLAGGDTLSPDHVRRALDALPGTTVINGYGPTENTTFTTCHPMTPGTGPPRRVPIGRPIAGTRALVLDDTLRPVPAGVEGELYAAGDGLARGYFGRPALTAERFVPSPTTGASTGRGEPPGARLYATGDRARWLPDGTIDFLGRRDGQVKLRGFRIETGEIESALSEHPGVRQAVVVLRKDVADGALVAYVVGGNGEAPGAAELREHLAARLPGPMVPSAFVALEALPLDPNGKPDRKALPAPTIQPGDEAGEHPLRERTPVEELVAGIWADVLGREGVPPGADFFDLGGHSLLATRVVSRIRDALGTDLPLAALFEAPTVEALARRVDGAALVSAPAPAIEPGPLEGEHPLSFPQERIWLLDQFDRAATIFNTLHSLELTGRLDAPALGRAFTGLAARHAVLRTRFPSHDGRPVQVIDAPEPVALPVVDLSGLPAGARRAELARRQRDEGRRPFDLEAAPPVRLRLLRLGSGTQVLLLCLHHLVADGWSLGVLLRELAAFYRGEPGLPELPIQYADFARWQREHRESHDRQVEYWRERLADPARQDLPTDRPRSQAQRYRGAQHVQRLPPGLSGRLAALGRREGATLFMTLLAAFEALLLRHTGEPDVLVGTPIAGRVRAEVEGLIGVFLETLVLRTDLSGDPTFGELLARVREAALGAYAHQEVPFERLLEELQPERDPSRTPWFQVFFNLLNFPQWTAALPGLEMRLLRRPEVPAKFDLGLYLRETDDREGGVEVLWIYDADLFDAATVGRLARQYECALAAGAGSPEERLSRLPLLPASERHQVLVEWNDAGLDSERGDRGERPVHELFFERARRTPEATALVWDGGSLDYGTLAERADALARELARRGAGPESVVALPIERSPELAVALLGTLKAGAVALPLDPSHPTDRLRGMIEDAGAEDLVADELGMMRVPAWRDRGLRLAHREREGGEDPAPAPPLPAHRPDPSNPAYVVYTSGSTGEPKGAVITHRTLALRLAWMQHVYRLVPGERVLHKASPGFDVAVWEILWPLSAGAAVVVAHADGHKDPGYLRRTIVEHQVALVHFVPSMLELFLGEPGLEECRGLRVVLSGGESLPAALLARARERLPGTLYNQYGMSEACIDVTWWNTTREEAADPVPIGRPYGDTAVHLLGPDLRPAPVGAVAELWVGGDDGLLRGYRNDPRRTAEAVVPDPFAGTLSPPGARLYRTGDLARRRPDGAVVHAGRADHQIKLRGVRIAPQEIEHDLARHPGVELAAVVAREARLVAYVQPARSAQAGGDAPSPEALRQHLRARLPEAMIPSRFELVDELPRTASGKIDRRELARRELGDPAPETRRSTPPRTRAETIVARAWTEVLKLQRVGVEDNFFELGGHSLFAVQVVARLRKDYRVELPLRYLFQAPDLESLAREVEARLDDGGDGTPSLVEIAEVAEVAADRSGGLGDPAPAPLTLAQKPFWWGRHVTTAPASTLPIVCALEGALDRRALACALSRVVERHAVLRTTFAGQNGRDGTAVQVVHPPRRLPLPWVDLSGLPEAAREAARRELVPRLVRRPWDLTRGPLVRAFLFVLGPERHALAVFTHHVLLDGWSSGLFMDELESLYGDLTRGREPARPAPAVQYGDFARWQARYLAGAQAREHLGYWRERFGDLGHTTAFPADREAPRTRSHLGGTLAPAFPRELALRLRALAAAPGRTGTTLYMVLLAALQAVLMRRTGRRDTTVITPYANRQLAETEPMLGSFYSMLPIRTRLDRPDGDDGDGAAPGVRDLLARVEEATLEAYAHAAAMPDEVLRRVWTHPEAAGPDEPPVSRVLLALQNTAELNRTFDGLRVRVEPHDSGRVRFDTALFVYEGPEELIVRLRYDRELYREETAAGWFRELLEVLGEAAGR